MSSPSAAAFLVTGATGAQGGSVARELLKAGQRVHALVRDPSKRAAKELESLGAVLFVGDYDNVDVINKATTGVKGLFINTYPVPGDEGGELKHALNLLDAARAAGSVKHIVISTSFLAGDHERWLAEDPNYAGRSYYHSKASAEAAVRASGITWTILRPPWLFQNYTYPQSVFNLPVLHSERRFLTGVRPDLLFAHLDAADIGRWAAAAFLDPQRFGGKALRPAVENLTLEEIAQALETFAGVKIERAFVTPAELPHDPKDPIGALRAEVAVWQNRGEAWEPAEELEEIKSYGIPLTTFAEFLAKNKAAVFATLNVKE
ncbi:NAD dependent epimerase/dehydratase [Auricularia subglabra TFB-10046 SS5]|nr:NAD dependent epimerase/dehydratase [Auricularia subglabra TFB-10046 SS5]